MRFAGLPDTASLERELRDRLDRLIALSEETNRLLLAMLQITACDDNGRGLFGEMERKGLAHVR